MANPILIVGASGRAAAASAIRAGFEPHVIDLFADADTMRLCPTIVCPSQDYPHGLIALANAAPPMPWMYTGGLENHPDVVMAISEHRELVGNDANVLREVRDVTRFARTVRERGGHFPPTIPTGNAVAADGIWLHKSATSSGGLGVRFAITEDFDGHSHNMQDCLQKFIDGDPMSAIYHSDGQYRSTLFGMTWQLIGTPWLHAKPFAYAGNITRHDESLAKNLAFHGELLSQDFHLKGGWGLDFIDNHNGKAFTIEMNPRYTAAVEVLEFATGKAFLGDATSPRTSSSVVGKAIYYAPHRIVFPTSGPWDESLANCTDVWRCPDFADIPHGGSQIETGQPVCTLFAEACTEADCLEQLRRHARELDTLFGFSTNEVTPV